MLFIVLRSAGAVAMALAATFGLYSLIILSPQISAALQDIVTSDLKTPLLLGFVGLYFIIAVQVWYRTILNWRHKGQESRITMLSRTIFYPAFAIFSILAWAVYELLSYALLRHFHVQTRAIADRAIAVFLLAWVFVYSILVIANMWPHEKSRCEWKFPKILSCVLTNYEDLAGGAIAAAFTIFAGWLAWLAVQQQISGWPREAAEAPPVTAEARRSLDAPVPAASADEFRKPIWARAVLIAIALYFATGIIFLAFEYVASLVFSSTEIETEEDEVASKPEINVCAPLLDARMVVRDQEGRVTDDFPIETANETVVLIRNETDKQFENGTILIRPIGFTKSDAAMFASTVRGSATIAPNSIRVDKNESVLTIRFNRLAPKEFIATNNTFGVPVGSFPLDQNVHQC